VVIAVHDGQYFSMSYVQIGGDFPALLTLITAAGEHSAR
jgi:hypothetical protein